ncbi:MAG: DNA-processing protein DprA [Caldisericia bacterium]|nr:DNA-processing protein DprA [Caldisericia bacterium]HQG82114.1 DNA-processing protein DprA [Caldisericia bacterium]HXK70456.1 DNA-processing protein DprA [Caldisericia bacterium]
MISNLYLRYTYLIYVKKTLKYKQFNEIKDLNENELPDKILDTVNSKNASNFVEGELEKALKLNAKIVEYNSEDYPTSVKHIKNSPPVLYIKGELGSPIKTIAIVGSRKATTYGLKVAYEVGFQLGQRKVTVVSGMAYGIDSSAHRGAIDAKGRTYAVLGCGVDITYPKQNKKLKEEIENSGALISEFPFSTDPLNINFPVRNRIISAISDGVIVVEASEKSGALLTADYALDQGKDVYAVPGSIYSELSRGTNQLIKSGAIPYLNINDIYSKNPTVLQNSNLFKNTQLTDEEKIIINSIDDFTGKNLNEIIDKTGLKANKVMITLTELELKGLIEMINGKYLKK